MGKLLRLSFILLIASCLMFIGITDSYLITYTDYNLQKAGGGGGGGGHERIRPPSKMDTYHRQRPPPPSDQTGGNSLDLNQMIVFNVGDFVSLENYTRSFR